MENVNIQLSYHVDSWWKNKYIFPCLTDMFGLTIHLWMIDRRQFTIDSEEPKQVVPTFRDELLALITDDIIGKAISSTCSCILGFLVNITTLFLFISSFYIIFLSFSFVVDYDPNKLNQIGLSITKLYVYITWLNPSMLATLHHAWSPLDINASMPFGDHALAYTRW